MFTLYVCTYLNVDQQCSLQTTDDLENTIWVTLHWGVLYMAGETTKKNHQNISTLELEANLKIIYLISFTSQMRKFAQKD